MQFTSLKAFLKPGTKFYYGNTIWKVEEVIRSRDSTPLGWLGSCKAKEGSYKPTGLITLGCDDAAYEWATIIQIGGTPIQLEDLI